MAPPATARDTAGHPRGDRARPGGAVALSVSKLIGQRELVTRPLPPNVAQEAAVSGAAVLSNGDIVLLADCDALTLNTNPALSVAERVAALARGRLTICREAMNAFTDMQLDALRELANIGSGNAGTALSSMLGKSVDISVPTAAALPLAEAVAIAGAPDELRHGVVVPSSATSRRSSCCSSPTPTPGRSAASTASSPRPRTAARCSARSATSSGPTTSTCSPRWSAW